MTEPRTTDQADETVGPLWLDVWLVEPGASTEVGAPIRLAGSWCESCGRMEFPQRSSCPSCDQEMANRPLSGSGAVVGVTAVLHQPPGAKLQAPYGVVAVTHGEGITVLGPAIGPDWERIAIGDEVDSITIDVGDGVSFGYRRG